MVNSWRFHSKGLLLLSFGFCLASCQQETAPIYGWAVENGIRIDYAANQSGLALHYRILADGSTPVPLKVFGPANLHVSGASSIKAPDEQVSFHQSGEAVALLFLLADRLVADPIAQLQTLAPLSTVDLGGRESWAIAVSDPEFRIAAELGPGEDLAALGSQLHKTERDDPAYDHQNPGSALIAALDYLFSRPELRRALVVSDHLLADLDSSTTTGLIQKAGEMGTPIYVLTQADQLSDNAKLVAQNTFGRIFPWLGAPPGPNEASYALSELFSGGSAVFDTSEMLRLPFAAGVDSVIRITLAGRKAEFRVGLPAESISPFAFFSPSRWLNWLGSASANVLSLLLFCYVGFLVLGAILILKKSQIRTLLATIEDPKNGRIFRVHKLPFTMGRDNQADLCIDETVVSRIHAQIEAAENGGFLIRDMSSTNGTFLDSAQILRARLGVSENISLGTYNLKFKIVSDPV